MATDPSLIAALQPQRISDRCDELGRLSELDGGLTRVFLSPEQKQASERVLRWMRDAGMAAQLDAIGNCAGRYEGERPGLPCLMLGSHLDTVRDAGKYDGMLGVISAIECVSALNALSVRLPFAIEVVGFGDEEGVRFGSTLLGSRAVAGAFDFGLLDKEDANGTTMRDALRGFGLDPAQIAAIARKPTDVLAYAELHIEQGPVLEAEGLATGVVTAINGGNRFSIELNGMAGHAGTVPMGLRRDALAAAAECVVAVERIAASMPDIVGTVGRLEALPGAMNVIPGKVRFSLDVRAPTDEKRHAAVAAIRARVRSHRAAPRHRHDDHAAVGSQDVAVRSGPAASDRRRHRGRGRARAPPAFRRGPRRHGAHRNRANRHALRPLQGRDQPQPGGSGDARRRRCRRARFPALHRRVHAAAPLKMHPRP